ncbi:MAG: hypothetical protein AB1349_09265 [Elusimicrobiota bacterium]
MSDYIKHIIESGNNKLNGKLYFKIFSGEIVYLEKLERIFPKEKAENKILIPVGLCSKFIDRLRKDNFFGNLVFSFNNGKITEIKISQIYKLEDIKKFLALSG